MAQPTHKSLIEKFALVTYPGTNDQRALEVVYDHNKAATLKKYRDQNPDLPLGWMSTVTREVTPA